MPEQMITIAGLSVRAGVVLLEIDEGAFYWGTIRQEERPKVQAAVTELVRLRLVSEAADGSLSITDQGRATTAIINELARHSG